MSAIRSCPHQGTSGGMVPAPITTAPVKSAPDRAFKSVAPSRELDAEDPPGLSHFPVS